MRAKFTMLVGVLALVMTAVAPAAQADTLTVTNSYEEAAKEIYFPDASGATITNAAGPWYCSYFDLSAEVTENEADPVTLSGQGAMSGCKIYTLGVSVQYGPVDVNSMTLSPDGTGTMSFHTVENGYWGECALDGTLQLEWASGSDVAFDGTLQVKTLKGGCPGERTIQGTFAAPLDENLAPAGLVVTP